ncbi:MAG: hypothetical protein HFI93_00485 [Lachnospiraceae bacterium]|nr:hypothetical protein [Lachnospiraceae bacterium]
MAGIVSGVPGIESGIERLNRFGIRHHSPAGAWHLREFLDKVRPERIFVEGPSDFTDLIEGITNEAVELPIAVMAYTEELPVRTLLYPLAEYSPEYQALLWAKEHGCECRFFDLPSDVFLGMEADRGEDGEEETGGKEETLVYARLDEAAGAGGQEAFWERVLENSEDAAGYQKGAELFGRFLRELSGEPGPAGSDGGRRENALREAYMRGRIREALAQGIAPEKIVTITGAYHVEGLAWEAPHMEETEFSALARRKTRRTLMPYSYYRLSRHSGYGAGNRAPAYCECLWEARQRGRADYAAYRYLSGLAAYQRKYGQAVSSAEVIEAVRLASALASLRGGKGPVLEDLRDAAVTCMGHGKFSEIALAVADTEIGTRLGTLPKGMGQTSIQADFYRELERLKLEKYRSLRAEELKLDLREKLTVQSRTLAFLDRERSFFLHRLRILGIRFASPGGGKQENATYAERWVLQWTPEAEIQIVEAVLKGDTVARAAAFQLKEQAEKNGGIGSVARTIRDAFLCGLPEAVSCGAHMLQATAVDAAGMEELAQASSELSQILKYGDIRNVNREGLIPILEQLFLRACLLLPGECVCDAGAADKLAEAVRQLDEVVREQDFLEEERWISVLEEISGRDDLNTKLSGFATAIRLEKGRMNQEEIHRETARRLSKGMPADLGASWFEGLALRNHYALIARLFLWQSLSDYLDTLDEEEFKRSLVFLRRAFSGFTSSEKDQIAENLGEIWGMNPNQVSEMVNEILNEEDQALVDTLSDFDFGDI